MKFKTRHYFLDWLRVLVIINLIPFHAAWAIEYVPGFSQNSGNTFQDIIFEFYVISTSRWQMPLLFFISGISTWMALGYKSVRSYSLERIKRLLVPLVFFMFFLYQPLAFFWPSTPSDKNLTSYLFDFYPYTFSSMLYDESTGGPGWAHMWFVAYLLIFSFLMLPWFAGIRRNTTIKAESGLINRKFNLGMIILTGLAYALILIVLEPVFPGHRNNLYTDWSYFTYNFISFILGFLLCENKSFWSLLNKYAWWLFSLGFAMVVIQTFIIMYIPSFTRPEYSYKFWLFALFWGFNTWFGILALLGLARRYINLDNRFLRYFSPASYPIYIIHLVLMVVIGHYMRPWHYGLLSEFLLLSLLTFVTTMLVYEIVKRSNVSRFLFGIKRIKHKSGE